MQDPSSRDRVCEIAYRGLDIELRKKFQGVEFRDFYELVAKVTKYEEPFKEEVHGNLLSRGEPGSSSAISIYYRDIHLSSFGRKDT